MSYEADNNTSSTTYGEKLGFSDEPWPWVDEILNVAAIEYEDRYEGSADIELMFDESTSEDDSRLYELIIEDETNTLDVQTREKNGSHGFGVQNLDMKTKSYVRYLRLVKETMNSPLYPKDALTSEDE